MYAVVRRYTGSPGLADKFAARGKEIEKIIRTAPGFIAYYMVKTGEGAVTVTVCENQAGAEASNRIAADWIRQNMADLAVKPPEIQAGDVVVTTTTQAAVR